MSKRRTEELLKDLKQWKAKQGQGCWPPTGWDLFELLQRLAEIVDDLETLEADRQEHPNQ